MRFLRTTQFQMPYTREELAGVDVFLRNGAGTHCPKLSRCEGLPEPDSTQVGMGKSRFADFFSLTFVNIMRQDREPREPVRLLRHSQVTGDSPEKATLQQTLRHWNLMSHSQVSGFNSRNTGIAGL